MTFGLIVVGLGLILGIRYLTSSDHLRGGNAGSAAEPFSNKDPGTGDPGQG